ncbi:hypothetical protein AVEN_27058-1 [Araneus ventricosus]|uniref:Uncharacterized protein n=1 Tax=Araneus ventricosus TaxID=182803 RepID=A0A4Y2JC05_ARAVE|nr:hypothetical protein AVEN_27058-1 [Araneus ventricosus]
MTRTTPGLALPSPNFRATPMGGHLAIPYDLACNRSHTLRNFSEIREGAAIVSAALQDVGIIAESNVLNVVDRNKIRRGRTKARTTLLSQVIKDYDHGQFGLYFDGRKDRTLSIEDNRRKVVIEEHRSLVKEPGSEYTSATCLQISGERKLLEITDIVFCHALTVT